MRTAFIDALLQAANSDPDIWLVNADLGFSVLERFAERFPDRYLNVGVAEQNMIGVAAGLALSGCKVFVYSIANFPTQRCLEQIRVDICYHKAHVVVTAVGGGFAYGSQGYTHHGIEDLAVMRALPGMRVAVPADPHEVRSLVQEFAARPGPAYLRLGRGGEPSLHSTALARPPLVPLIMRDGRDVAILAAGPIVAEVMEAAAALEKDGIFARIISVPLLKPLATDELIAQIGDCPLVVTVEEHSLIGGLRDAVAPVLAARAGSPRLVAFGVGDGETFGVIKGQAAMRAHVGIDARSLAVGIRRAIVG